MSNIIGRIALQPSVVRPGATLRVEVFDTQDNPLQGGVTEVSINGIPGGLQFLQFPSEGPRRIAVRARTRNGETDRQVVTVEVSGPPLQFPAPNAHDDITMIGVTQLRSQPYTAILTLGSWIDVRSPNVLQPGSRVSPLGKLLRAKASSTARLSQATMLTRLMAEHQQHLLRTETQRLVNARPRSRQGVSEQAPSRARDRPRRVAIGAIYDLSRVDVESRLKRPKLTRHDYEWDFGDGHTEVTHTPTVSHDFFHSIDHTGARGLGQFVVTCHVRHAGITVQRTLSIQSAYAICKAAGTIVPHVEAELFAYKRYNLLTSTFVVHNVEDSPIVFDRVSITPTSIHGDALALPQPFIMLGSPVTVAAKSTSMVGVNVPFVTDAPSNGQLRFDIEGFTVLYAGTCGNKPVRCSVTFDVPVAEWSKRPVLVPLPRVPDLVKKPWPWEIVEKAFEALVNPAGEQLEPGAAVLDTKTGTLAVSIGQQKSLRGNTALRDAGARVLSSVYAPIGQAMAAAQRAKAPTVQYSAKAVRESESAAAVALSSVMQSVRSERKLAVNVAAVLRATAEPAAAAAPDTKRFLPKASAAAQSAPAYHTLEGPPPPGFVSEGQVCDPDNLSEEELALADVGQLVCQLTDEEKEVLMPARWMNARKGDCILSPGGDGLIGGLMLNVNPAQWYSHSGIMTRNYDEITHSTGSKDRLEDHLIGFTADGSDGFEPSVLKYIWPGAVTQTVQHSIEGETFPDPEYDKSYSISSFGSHTVGVTHNDQMKMIPPLVLKPDPLQETPAVRTHLHAIATDARNDAGRPGVKPKYHYRWYCYTDPTIGQGAPAGSEAGWAEGTHASVCSSYIWMHAKARGAHLETSQSLATPTDLEATPDLAEGAAVRPTTPDGLYNYSAAEREDAAEWLYDTIYNQAYEKAGWFGVLLTDAADDVANQFLNAFANDDADGKDSEDWRDVVDADAVSPDNMIWWDSPSQGGLFGFVEPALYREPRIEKYTISRWKKVLNRGNIHGKVFGSNGPVAGGLVRAYDGKENFSSASGMYNLVDVPLGRYLLKASKVIDGVLHSAEVNVNLAAADLAVDIHLQPPSERFRVAQVFIDFWGRDYETFGDDEIKDPGPEYFELELGPDKTINSARRTYKWGGEMRVEYTITVRLLVNNAIDVDVQGVLYEGTSEDTDDLDGQGGLTFQVGLAQTVGATLTITNTDEDDDDAGILSISVKNVRNSN